MGILDSIHRDDKTKCQKTKEKDFYQTPTKASKILLHHLTTVEYVKPELHRILDPCCGENAIAGVFEEAGFDVTKFDKFPCNTSIRKVDFLNLNDNLKYDITTMNSPYTKKKEFIRKALEVSSDVFAFLPLQVINYIDFTTEFLDSDYYRGRISIYPKMILTQTQKYKQGGMTAYAWFHYSKTVGNSKKYEYFYDMRKF